MSDKRKAKSQATPSKEKVARKGDADNSSEKGKYVTNPEFKQLLLNSSVESLAYQKKNGVVFFVDRTDKVSDVFKGLVNQNFLSVPVLQKTKRKWYGFIEISDIVQFYVEHFGDLLGDEGKKVWETIAEKEGFMEKTVTEVMKFPLSRKNPFHPITLGYSLYYAIETLAREKSLRRVPIIDHERNLKSVLSQSQVIEFISEHMDMLGSIKDKPISEMKSVLKEVYSVNEDSRAIDAFKLMQQKNIGGVAVIDDEGKVVGALSERDLKTIRVENQLFHRLFQKVRNFISHLREEFQEKDGRPKTKKIAQVTDTLGQVVDMLVTHSIHRVYVVDDQRKPIGVVSLRDILLEIISC